jgi:hypothetical protein
MGGGTGNLRTQRISASNGYRTLGSILANTASGDGAGGLNRLYKWYYRQQLKANGFYFDVLGLREGEYRDRANLFMKNA